MSKILDVTQTHTALWPRHTQGVDVFAMTVPEGEVFHSCRLTVLQASPGAGASVAAQPAAGESGAGQIVVAWKQFGGGWLKYRLEAFAGQAGSSSGQQAPSAVRTGFDPCRHGFRFINAFPPYPHIQLFTPFGRIRIGDAKNGLCGGMVFAALDYFHAGRALPDVAQPPAGDALFAYIVRRLYDSFNLPFGVWGYIAWMRPALPDYSTGWGAHFSRAWHTVRREWPAIKALLDAGQPCPLGLVRVRSADLRRLGENHQVLAYGYDTQGSQVTLFVYDPNYGRDDRIALTLDLSNPEGPTTMTYSTGEPLYAFFRVRYRFKMPPQA